jgi:hypothetical protein
MRKYRSRSAPHRRARTATTITLPTLAPRRVTMARDISIMEFFWEWDHGRIGAITTGGAAIAFAARAEDDITRTPDTMRVGHREAGTRRIIAQRAMAAGRMVTADLFIMTTGRRGTVADHTTITAAVDPRMVAEGVGPTGTATDINVSLSSENIVWRRRGQICSRRFFTTRK